MSNPILHIKDSYYFEVPKVLWRSDRKSLKDFPNYWVKLDGDYLDWQAGKLYDSLKSQDGNLIKASELPAKEALLGSYQEWREHGHHNLGKPLARFLEESPDQKWFQESLDKEGENGEAAVKEWASIRSKVENDEANVEVYLKDAKPWSPTKVEKHNRHLDGKILIPQPFGKLKNNYEAASGFCISKYMIIELLVAVIIAFLFIRLAGRMKKSGRPTGKFWNMYEAILMYFRDEVVKPSIGEHDAAKFTPLLWTIFLFILGSNLFGLLPWMGSPTTSISVTIAMAAVTFATGWIYGSIKFGAVGFWKNQVPALGMPWYGAMIIVPMLFVIEVVGLFIKHGVLGIRLVANMIAGHLVLLSLMGLAVSAAGSSIWGVAATASVIGATLLSCLELFVAFLQAFVFTLLSALFIGASIHHH